MDIWDSFLLWFIIFMMFIIGVGIITMIAQQDACEDEGLKFSWGSMKCYDSYNNFYTIENVGFWMDYKINKNPSTESLW